MLNFVAIDFEHANKSRGSVCQVGAVKVLDSQIKSEFSTLIHPPESLDDFETRCIQIHGIRPEDVKDAPTWGQVSQQLQAFIGSLPLVAHSAAVEKSCIIGATEATPGLTWHLPLNFIDTLSLAKTLLNLPCYGLKEVNSALGLPIFSHHDACADARASALVLLEFAKLTQSETLEALQAYVSRNPPIRAKSSSALVLPKYVISQYYALLADCGEGKFEEYDALMHPDGRAKGGEDCVVCGETIGSKVHYSLRNRHVCSINCNDRLKRCFRKELKR